MHCCRPDNDLAVRWQARLQPLEVEVHRMISSVPPHHCLIVLREIQSEIACEVSLLRLSIMALSSSAPAASLFPGGERRASIWFRQPTILVLSAGLYGALLCIATACVD